MRLGTKAKLSGGLNSPRWLVGRSARYALVATHGGRPISVSLMTRLNGLAGGGAESLAGLASARKVPLSNTWLQSRSPRLPISDWTLPAVSLNVIEELIKAQRPRVVLEMGSGVSTVCVARYMTELHGTGGPYVYSLEQSPAHASQTEAMLDDFDLGGAARVFHAPLVEQHIAGVNSNCYAVPQEIGTMTFDMLLVDGPAGEPGIRVSTLPLVLDQLSGGAIVLLDDALRRGELGVARAWALLPSVHVDGVLMSGHGLLLARTIARSS